MKLAPTAAVTTCCCALLAVSASAETCDQRFPGSCRLEVSTTIVTSKAEAVAAAPRSYRRVKRARKPAAKRVRVAVVATVAAVPVPLPSPRRIESPVSSRPTAVVDDAFNSLTVSDATDRRLEEGLIIRRDQMLGFMLR